MTIPGAASRLAQGLGITLAFAVAPLATHAQQDHVNGFDLTDALVPRAEILSGGPPKDGIPAIDRPRFIKANAAKFLFDESRVLGVFLNGEARAYPVSILNWHEVVNDQFGAEGIAVTFCPLCGTGMAFRAGTARSPMTFGVSGLLYNSDVLLYDRQTHSLWSQILSRAVSGPRKGGTLEAVPVSHTTWRDWRAQHPGTTVLSRETGFDRDYGRDPYETYVGSETVMFPVSAKSRRYHPKERVIGLKLGDVVKAYPFVELDASPRPLRDRIGKRSVTVEFDAVNRTGRVLGEDGKEIPTVVAFWFAWFAFHPDTEVHRFGTAAPATPTPGDSR